MRLIPVLATALLIVGAAPALAQDQQPLSFTGVWARATPGGAKNGAVYLTIKSGESSPDRLVGGSSPVAQDVQIHEMSVTNGIMRMRRLKSGLAIPAHGSAALAPDGYHLMLLGLKQPLKSGDNFPLTLDFAKAGASSVEVHVLPLGAPAPKTTPAESGGMSKMGGMEMK